VAAKLLINIASVGVKVRVGLEKLFYKTISKTIFIPMHVRNRLNT